MAAIQNARTLRLQATVPRITPIPITIGDIDGLGAALKRITLSTSASVIYGTAPSSVTLTATRHNGVTGTMTWAVISGTATLTGSGDSRSIAAATIPLGTSALIQASCDGVTAVIGVSRSGVLAGQSQVDLASQITGQLASGNVNGLRALALLDAVSLSNPLQVLGDLAAERIGVGTLAAGVAYIGNLNAAQVTAGTFTGRSFRTAASGKRAEIMATGAGDHYLRLYDASNVIRVNLAQDDESYLTGSTWLNLLRLTNTNPNASSRALVAECSAGTAIYASGPVCLQAAPGGGDVGLRINEGGSNAVGLDVLVGGTGAWIRNTSTTKTAPDLIVGSDNASVGGLLVKKPRNTNPTPTPGGDAMRNGVGPIWSDGTNWYRYSDNSIVT